MRVVSCYYPGRDFPSISITGDQCALQCPHCMAHPLSCMLCADSPERLITLACELERDQALGFLLSGGYDSKGVLPVGAFLPAIRRIKETTELSINAHIGYPRRDALPSIVDSGIDAYSVNFPMSDRVGRTYFQVENALARFEETVEGLHELGAKRVIPHMLIGLGDSDEDIKGMRLLSDNPPESLVVLAFTPIRGTPLEDRAPTESARIIDTIAIARQLMPETKLVLGCMRPRGAVSSEIYLMRELVDGIVLPARSVEKSLQNHLSLERLRGCCAIHL